MITHLCSYCQIVTSFARSTLLLFITPHVAHHILTLTNNIAQVSNALETSFSYKLVMYLRQNFCLKYMSLAHLCRVWHAIRYQIRVFRLHGAFAASGQLWRGGGGGLTMKWWEMNNTLWWLFVNIEGCFSDDSWISWHTFRELSFWSRGKRLWVAWFLCYNKRNSKSTPCNSVTFFCVM